MEHTNPIPDTKNLPKKPKKKSRPVGLKVFFGTLKVLGTVMLIGIFTGLIMMCYASLYIKNSILPNISLPPDITTNLSSTISYYDPNTGNLEEMRTIYGSENRIWVDYEELPEDLINATVAIEDKRFWTHNGVDWKRTVNGIYLMFTGRDIQGGSTITQQLIKNMTDEDEITVKRKIIEIFRALEYEKQHPDKTEILELYLNYIFLGENCNGVYTASYAYFGKHVSELSLAECASLIGITNNPSLYNPYINREGNKKRQEDILWTMWDQGIISEERYEAALAEELVFQRGEDETAETSVFSWYEDQVITDLVQDLQEEYGLSAKAASSWIYNGGLQIVIAYDPDIQAVVDEVYTNVENLNIPSKSGQQLQSAIVIIDNQTGNVVAMAGGMGEKNQSLLYNMGTRARRSPGSAFKPLSVYAPALELGIITPSSVYDDAPLRMLGGSTYPANSYGYYRGLTSITNAVTVSSNPVAMRVLQDLTPATSFDFLVNNFGLGDALVVQKESNGKVHTDIDLAPLALGGLTDGVTVLEMAAAYSVFPRDGVYIAPRTYLYVLDSNGNILLDNQTESKPVLSQKTAYYINTLLKNVVRSGGTGTSAYFDGMTIAGKTGSTNNNYDRWFVGYTPYYTAAVWCGYKQQERIYANESNPSARMWRLVMQPIHENLERKEFTNLSTTAYDVCLDSGMRATEYCAQDPRGSRVTTGHFVAGDQPTDYCDLHSEDSLVEICKDCPILDANGAETGTYHLAGEFCPEESRAKVALLYYTRVGLTGEGYYTGARDNNYLYVTVEGYGECTVHTDAPEPKEFDPFDPSTWPTPAEDPNFDPTDPSTWPLPPDPIDDPNTDPGTDPGDETTAPPEDPHSTTPPDTGSGNPDDPDASPSPTHDMGIPMNE